MKKQYIIGIIVILVIAVAAVGAYALLSDDNKAEKSDVFYLYIQTESSSDTAGLPYDQATMEEGFWIKSNGANALDAIEKACSDNDWKFTTTEFPGQEGIFLNSIWGLEMKDTNGVYEYWVVYSWDSGLDSFKYSDLALDKIVATDDPQYIALIYKVDTYPNADVPPSVTPNDIPSDVL